jgi:hypothetical protein
MMIAPRIRANSPEEEDGDSRVTCPGVRGYKIRCAGKIYEFRSINQEASRCVTSRFERVLLQVAIENSEFFLGQLKRIKENDSLF